MKTTILTLTLLLPLCAQAQKPGQTAPRGVPVEAPAASIPICRKALTQRAMLLTLYAEDLEQLDAASRRLLAATRALGTTRASLQGLRSIKDPQLRDAVGKQLEGEAEQAQREFAQAQAAAKRQQDLAASHRSDLRGFFTAEENAKLDMLVKETDARRISVVATPYSHVLLAVRYGLVGPADVLEVRCQEFQPVRPDIRTEPALRGRPAPSSGGSSSGTPSAPGRRQMGPSGS